MENSIHIFEQIEAETDNFMNVEMYFLFLIGNKLCSFYLNELFEWVHSNAHSE